MTFVQFLFVLRHRQYGHRNGLCSFVGLDPAEHFHSGDLRQVQVQQHQIRPVLDAAFRKASRAKQVFQSLRAIARDLNRIGDFGFPKGLQSQIHIVLIILHEQDFPKMVAV